MLKVQNALQRAGQQHVGQLYILFLWVFFACSIYLQLFYIHHWCFSTALLNIFNHVPSLNLAWISSHLQSTLFLSKFCARTVCKAKAHHGVFQKPFWVGVIWYNYDRIPVMEPPVLYENIRTRHNYYGTKIIICL